MWTEEAHNCEMKFLKSFADWFHCVSFLQIYVEKIYCSFSAYQTYFSKYLINHPSSLNTFQNFVIQPFLIDITDHSHFNECEDTSVCNLDSSTIWINNDCSALQSVCCIILQEIISQFLTNRPIGIPAQKFHIANA